MDQPDLHRVMLLLCLTGLPLIFHQELEELLGRHPALAELPADAPMAKLDRLVVAAESGAPGWCPVEPLQGWFELCERKSKRPGLAAGPF